MKRSMKLIFETLLVILLAELRYKPPFSVRGKGKGKDIIDPGEQGKGVNPFITYIFSGQTGFHMKLRATKLLLGSFS